MPPLCSSSSSYFTSLVHSMLIYRVPHITSGAGVTTMNMSENLKSKQMQTVITRRGRGLCHGDSIMMGDSFVLRNEGSACQGGVLVQITIAGHHWLAGCIKQQHVPRLWRLGSLCWRPSQSWCLVRACFLVCRWHPSCVLTCGDKLHVSFIRSLILFMRAPLS